MKKIAIVGNNAGGVDLITEGYLQANQNARVNFG